MKMKVQTQFEADHFISYVGGLKGSLTLVDKIGRFYTVMVDKEKYTVHQRIIQEIIGTCHSIHVIWNFVH